MSQTTPPTHAASAACSRASSAWTSAGTAVAPHSRSHSATRPSSTCVDGLGKKGTPASSHLGPGIGRLVINRSMPRWWRWRGLSQELHWIENERRVHCTQCHLGVLTFVDFCWLLLTFENLHVKRTFQTLSKRTASICQSTYRRFCVAGKSIAIHDNRQRCIPTAHHQVACHRLHRVILVPDCKHYAPRHARVPCQRWARCTGSVGPVGCAGAARRRHSRCAQTLACLNAVRPWGRRPT